MSGTTKLAKGKEEGVDLESIVDRPAGAGAGEGSRVYLLSEIGYDTSYFNERAYENLLSMMEQDQDITGILIDGAITRLDRPEYLSDRLTYWDSDEDACKRASDDILNREQYQTMMDEQLRIVEERIIELKRRVPQAGKVVFSLHSEDLQYTASAMLNEMLLRGQVQIGEEIKSLKGRKNDIKKKRSDMEKERAALSREGGTSRKRAGLTRSINACDDKIKGIKNTLVDLYGEQKLYREKKVRPAHQHFTRKLIEEVFDNYRSMCERHGVELVTGQSKLEFGDMIVDYAHSRHTTWHPIRSRDKALVKSVHGKLKKLKGIDVLLESGHFGIGYKQLQKLKDHPDETNFRNQSRYDPVTDDSHVTIVMALPFEDHAEIGNYIKGRRPVRLAGGKPMGTRKTAAMDRYMNDGVTGLTILTRDSEGIVGTEWIQYQNFVDGSVLDAPDSYSIICASSDEHIGSPEESPIVRDGWMELYDILSENFTVHRGKPAVARGYINAGDAAEANSRKWDHRYHEKRDPQELMKENLRLLTEFDPKGIDDIVAMARKMTDDAMGGSVESMRVICRRVADYYEHFLKTSIERGLQAAHVVTTGNHSDGVLRDLGLRETDLFVERMKARGIGVFEVGSSQGYAGSLEEAPRVYVGGYSNARVLNIEDYGRGIDGTPLFGPINLLVQHDPKGSQMGGVIGAGKNADADLAISGHTHDNRMKLYRRDDNEFGVAYKLATLQGVSPTEKYYASSVPRTQAAHTIIMPVSGDFTEKAIPVSHLAEIGRHAQQRTVEEALDKRCEKRYED